MTSDVTGHRYALLLVASLWLYDRNRPGWTWAVAAIAGNPSAIRQWWRLLKAEHPDAARAAEATVLEFSWGD